MVTDFWEYLCLCFLGRNRILGPVEFGEPTCVGQYDIWQCEDESGGVRTVFRKRKTNIVYQYIYMESRKMVLMNLFAEQQ